MAMDISAEELAVRLQDRGLRLTRPRRVILEVLRGLDTHPTAEELYFLVKQRLPHISLGTVYRTLGILEDLGLVQELTVEKRGTRYNGNPQPHYHLACRRCGRVVDLDLPLLNELNAQVAAQSGFAEVTHRLEFCGYCPACQRENGSPP